MSQERWDIVLRFLKGPLSFQGDIVSRGPVVRMGAAPGPGGLRLDGYRGLDNRQAVITAYDGGTVSIAPVGANQVRVAPHEHQDWASIQTIRGPVYLDPGSAFHLGPPERGVTVVFIEAQRLGVWEHNRILSDSSQAGADVQPSNVREIDVQKGVPRWFVPGLLVMALVTVVAVMVPLIAILMPDVEPLGPVKPGQEVYTRADDFEQVQPLKKVPEELRVGINQAFHAFVMQPNAQAARWDALEDPDNWDTTFLWWVTQSIAAHARATNFWRRLDLIEQDYAFVVGELDAAGLPLVFAAIPYQESAYTADAQSYVCAKGWWQFMPEVALRAGLKVSNCKLRGSSELWSPQKLVVPPNAMRNAIYVDQTDLTCRIPKARGCQTDQRVDLAKSTRGAIELLTEAWEDPTIQDSGAAVQLTILSHNAGLDDQRHDPTRKTPRYANVLPAYRRYLDKNGLERAPDFYGQNIACIGKQYQGKEQTNTRCEGSVLMNQTQHYAYSVVAQHILAVCYYAQNYGNVKPWSNWKDYVRGDGYCRSIKVPEIDALTGKGG